MYFEELTPAVSLAMLPSTESPEIVIITLIVPHLLLSITTDREKIVILFSDHHVMETGLNLHE